MGYHIPYERVRFRPVNDVIAGNEESATPVEFDLVPAEGADRARLKSIMHATVGLSRRGDARVWGPEVQDAVIHAFETGAPVFAGTVLAVYNFTIPAALALRRGLISPADGAELPPDAKVSIKDGAGFARICGFVPAMAFHVAMKIVEISGALEADARFFQQPSGSGGTATDRRTPGTARSVPRRNAKRGTADSPTPPASDRAPTS